MRILRFLAICLLFVSPVLAQVAPEEPGHEGVLKVTDGNDMTAEQVVGFLAGQGITVTNAKLTGSPKGIGTFSAGNSAGIGFDEGVIMASGDVVNAIGPNESGGKSGTLGSAGDPDLDKLITPNKSQDATVLEFDFVTDSEDFGIKYVFASEEYQEFVDSSFNDVFAFLLNGKNIALIPNTQVPVTINNVNHKKNTAFYRDNPQDGGKFILEYDGLTAVLTAKTLVVPGQSYHIKLAVADASDSILDSAVFLAKGGITGTAVTSMSLDPSEAFLRNSESVDATLSAFALPKKGNLTLSASGLPEDSVVTFSTDTLNLNTTQSAVKVTIGPTTLPNDYVLVITATDERGKPVSAATMLIHVDCVPPYILGLRDNQPNSHSVNAGQRATLRVQAQGSGPYRYQWYQGPSGSTLFPVEGATAAEFQTPRIVTPANFWVRVSNACGAVDSDAALVSPR